AAGNAGAGYAIASGYGGGQGAVAGGYGGGQGAIGGGAYGAGGAGGYGAAGGVGGGAQGAKSSMPMPSDPREFQSYIAGATNGDGGQDGNVKQNRAMPNTRFG